MKIEYKGKMLSMNAIAKQETLSYNSLKSAYSETKDIYEAVKIAKTRQQIRVGSIEYKGKIMTIPAVARQEELSVNSLKSAYRETHDINEAVRIAKKRQQARSSVEYNGKMMTINAIAKRENISESSLRNAYNQTQDIYEAVRIARSNQRTKIEYNGQSLTIGTIAKQEKINRESLAQVYSETKDIYEAVKLVKQRQQETTSKRTNIEYKGQMMSISAIAIQEGLVPASLRQTYDETTDINEAVRIAKERQQVRSRIEYNGKIMSIEAIAKKENLSRNSLKKIYDETQNIYKAVLICQSRKAKKSKSKKVTTKFGTISLQDLSLILGIKYSELQSLIAKGFTIDQIQNMQIKTNKRNGITRTVTNLPNGQSLREYCIENSLNYSYIYRIINTYGKTVSEATQYYKKHGQHIPKAWIYERYGVLLRHIMLNDSIDIDRVVDYMRTDMSSLDEAVERYIIRRNAKTKDLDAEWMEEIYAVLTDINTKEEYDEWIEKFYVNDEEETCVIESYDETEKFRRKLDLFEICDVLINEVFTLDEEKELLQQYNITSEEIEMMFLDLYGRLNSGILRGQDQAEQKRKELLNIIIKKWSKLDKEQRIEICHQNGITTTEIRYIETTSSLIEEFKEVIQGPENQDEMIINIMRNSVKGNVRNNNNVRAEFKRIMEQSRTR